MTQRAQRRHSGVPGRSGLVIPLLLLGLLLTGLLTLVIDVQRGSRREFDERFRSRVDVASQFLETYNSDLVAREQKEARAELSGRDVTQQEFERVVDRFGFDAAVLLDAKGHLLAVTPYRSGIIGNDLDQTYRHLAQGVAGRVGISSVVPSAAGGVPLVAFAAPFDSASGRRVISGGYSVVDTPLGSYIENMIALRDMHALLVDEAGTIIASSEPTRPFAELSETDPALADVSGDTRSGAFDAKDGRRHFATHAVAGAPWRLVATVPETVLYEPIGGIAGWLPWVMLGVLTAAGVIVGWLVIRAIRQRVELTTTVHETQRLNQALHDFSGHVAHDLRGPLATIKMYAELLDDSDAETAEIRAVVERSADHGIQLTEDLLDLAKASGTARREPLDLESVVSAAVEGIDLVDVEVRSDGGQIVADRVGLTQAIRNLVSNSARYGRVNGRATVTVESIESADGWQIAVRDEGPGLPAGEAERIFEAFYRGAHATVKGTGLGLAIVSSVTESHGGHAWYEPGTTKGATFVMFLPKA